jgi:hypothetical protein
MGPFKGVFLFRYFDLHVRKPLVFQGANICIYESDRRQLKLLKTEEGYFNLLAKYVVALKDGALMQVHRQ